MIPPQMPVAALLLLLLLLLTLSACGTGESDLYPDSESAGVYVISDAEAGYDQAAYDACIDDAENDSPESCE